MTQATTPKLTATRRAAATRAGDVLIVASARSDGSAVLVDGHGLPGSAAAALSGSMSLLGATGRADDVVKVPGVADIAAPLVIVTGLGELDGDDAAAIAPAALRSAAGAAMRAATTAGTVVVALPAATSEQVSAVADGALAGAYRPAKVSQAAPSIGPSSIEIVTGVKGAATQVERAQLLAGARNWARDLVNMPPNLLFPASFAKEVRERVADSSGRVRVEVLDADALAEGGFGGITGVGQGSSRGPRLVTMRYAPRRAKGHLALVGKGITFDSGGLNLKPTAGMTTMKSDMAGAAAVAATVVAAAQARLDVAVTGYLALAENLPSATAQRPGDVVTIRNGTTVEIIDTDAEGRMVLADAIALAGESEPDAIVDIATLTGAQSVALGTRVAGVMGTDDQLRGRVVAAAERAGESAWPMPLPPELRAQLDSPNADLAHKGDRAGGMLVAAVFLSEFVPDGLPWSHIDIAGPAYNGSAPYGCTPKGGTGFGVATLFTLAEGFGR